MEDRPLIHWGIPGMKWGVRRRAATARMDKSGNVTVVRKGKRVPLMTTVRGKKVQVNGRQLSNKTREVAKNFMANQRKKQSHFSRSLKQKYGHESVSSLIKSVAPTAKKAAIVLVQAYVGYKVGTFIGNYAQLKLNI